MAGSGDSASGSNKRRRLSNGSNEDGDDDISEEKTVTTSKCKGATTIPIFLKSKCYCSVLSPQCVGLDECAGWQQWRFIGAVRGGYDGGQVASYDTTTS